MRRFKTSILVGAFLTLQLLLLQLGISSETQINNSNISYLSNKSCDIWEGSDAIPHLHAQDEKLLIACLGYIHGRDRAWEMDFFRKILQGRRAEFFGKQYIRSDFLIRLLGLQDKAKSLYQEMSPLDQQIFQSYSFGVNQGIQEAIKNGIYELKELHYSIDPWRPEDTIGLILLQSFNQTQRSFETLLTQEKWLKTHGNLTRLLFDPDTSIPVPWNTTILKAGEYLSSTHKPSQQEPTSTPGIPATRAEQGSNNWVISPKRSQSQHAWLANDPHLRLNYPSFWYWVHLNSEPNNSDPIDAIGATFPGIPIIISGTNRYVSWGLTNSYLPVAQLSWVPEKDLENHTQTFRPIIWFKFWKLKLPFFFKTYQKTTGNLPILPLPDPTSHHSGQALVLRWTGFDLHSKDLLGLYHLMKVRSIREADQVFSQVGIPSWNYVFADHNGGIGYRAIGRTPRFLGPLPYSIPTQSLSEVENSPAFSHPLSPQEMPHVLNPSRGYIATANNKQWPSDSYFNLGRAQVTGFRAFRIEELLKKTPQHDLTSLQKIQCDVQAVDARFILPLMIHELEKAPADWTPKERHALETLKTWNFEAHLQCTACALFRRWIDRIFDEENLNSVALYRRLILNSTPTLQESQKQIFRQSLATLFRKALQDLTPLQPDGLPEWGKVHLNFFEHLADSNLFPTPPISTPGDENTVNPGTSTWKDKYFDHRFGASQRLIVEMSNPPKVYSILPGIQRDEPHPHLTAPNSPWQNWDDCKLIPMEFPVDWHQIKSNIKHITTTYYPLPNSHPTLPQADFSQTTHTF